MNLNCANNSSLLFSFYKQQTSRGAMDFMGYCCHDDEVYYDADYRDHDDSGGGHTYDDYNDNY